MTMQQLTIFYPEDLLLSLKESPMEFESQARLLLAVKLYELGKVTTGMAARLKRFMIQAIFLGWNRMA